jgi:DNA-binding response OmpR family regulator
MPTYSILIIEDDAPFREALEISLKARGHRVTGANDGTEGLAAISAATFDLVVTDVVYPGRDSIEVIIERVRRAPGSRVIVMSGGIGALGPEHFLPLARKLGAHAILSKPFTEAELHAAIEKVFASEG